jgi:hypothetical protein
MPPIIPPRPVVAPSPRAQVPPLIALAITQPVTAAQRAAGKAIPLVKGGMPAPLAKQAGSTAKTVADAAKLGLVTIEDAPSGSRVYSKKHTLLFASKHGYAACVAWVNAASFETLQK